MDAFLFETTLRDSSGNETVHWSFVYRIMSLFNMILKFSLKKLTKSKDKCKN